MTHSSHPPADSEPPDTIERSRLTAFGLVDAAVIRDPSLPPTVKVVYTHLATYCGGDTRAAFPSRATIARETGLSVRGVDNAIKAAIAAGLMSVTQRETKTGGWTSSRYVLHDFGGYTAGSGPVAPKARRSGKGGGAPRALGQDVQGGGAPRAAEQHQGSTPLSSKSSTPSRAHSAERARQDAARAEAAKAKANRAQRRTWELPLKNDRAWLDDRNIALAEDIYAWVDDRYEWGAETSNMVETMIMSGYAPMRVLNAALKEGREANGIGPDDPLPSRLLNRPYPDMGTPVLDDSEGDPWA